MTKKKREAQNNPDRLEEEKDRDFFIQCAQKHSNKDVFDTSKLHVKKVWGIVRDYLTKRKKNPDTEHFILAHQYRAYERAPTKEQLFDGAYLDDDWMNKVIIMRKKLVSQPKASARLSVAQARKQRKTLGYFDVVFTSDGYEIFGVTEKKDKFWRDETPIISAHYLISLRPDDLPLGELHKRVFRLLQA